MTTRMEMAALSGAQPSEKATADLAVYSWGVDAPNDPRVQSLADILVMVNNKLGSQYRENRPEESVFWHNFRVADQVYHQNADRPQQLLRTFIAAAHDLCEDTRKSDVPVTPETIAAHWKGTETERNLIAAALHLKTDTDGVNGDARRARQHARVMEVKQGLHGEAGGIYAGIMAADKGDNMQADYEDLRDGRLGFPTRKAWMEWLFKKTADAQIVNILPTDNQTKQAFLQPYDLFMRQVILDRVLPTRDAVLPRSDAYLAKRLQRALALGANDNPTKKEIAAHRRFVRETAHTMKSDYAALREGEKQFDCRESGLEYAFAMTARAIVARAAPVPSALERALSFTYNALTAHLLYAGSIEATVIAPASRRDAETAVPAHPHAPSRRQQRLGLDHCSAA